MIIPLLVACALSIIGFVFAYGQDTLNFLKITLSHFNFSAMALDNDSLITELKTLKILPTTIWSAVILHIWTAVSWLLYFFVVCMFTVRRIRDIFGTFKIRYYIILYAICLIPFLGNFFVVLFYLLFPGKITKESKLIDPVIKIIG